MGIIIFAEEYKKTTKGTFLVWSSYAEEASKKHEITIILNNEHWCFEEITKHFHNNPNIKIKLIDFSLLSTKIFNYGYKFKLRLITILLNFLSIFLNFFSFPVIIFKLFLILKSENKKTLISHNGGLPGSTLCRWIIIASYFSKLKNRIFVIHSHPPPKYKNIFNWFQIKSLEFYSTKIVTVSDSVKLALEEKGFKKNIYRVYNGIKDKKNSLLKKKLNWQPSEKVIGFVGNLTYEKGVHILIKAFRSVNIPNIELALLGPIDQSFLPYLKDLAKSCDKKVSFLGYSDDVQFFMNNIDVLVVPAIAYESFSIVILEAMRNSIPVICSDFGGMKEVVVNDETGLIIPTKDHIALTNAINQLMKSKKLRSTMGFRGKRRFLYDFISKHMEKNYNKLL